jgi:hypothetical protein
MAEHIWADLWRKIRAWTGPAPVFCLVSRASQISCPNGAGMDERLATSHDFEGAPLFFNAFDG